MKPSHFLVTGCARSGTGYIATVLSSLDIPCGHEKVFCPTGLERGDEVVWPDETPGESSWLAAPFAANLPEEIPVLHQVREPVAFVRSKVRTRFFETPSWYKSFAEKIRPQLLEGDPIERSLRYWFEWNRMVEDLFGTQEQPSARPTLRYRLEEIDTGCLLAMLEVIGRPRLPQRVDYVLENLPRDYNTRGDRKRDELGWSSLPQGDLLDEVRAMATRYGYGEETEAGTLAIEPWE